MSDPKDTDKRSDPATLSFEQATDELEAIIARIESGEIGLEESLGEWRRGGTLLKRCREVLEKAEKELAAADLGEDTSSAD